jgi:hypothetical protein
MKDGPSGPSLGAGYLVLMIPLAASATGLAVIGFAVITAIVMLIALLRWDDREEQRERDEGGG